VVELLRAELPDLLIVYHWAATAEQFEATLRRTIRDPGMIVASDGIYHAQLPHPRGFGCFPRVLRVAVRELGAVSLEGAVARMSGRVADAYRIGDRGRLVVGLGADLVVFDPATVSDGATWEAPRTPPTGIDAVIVNGRVVVEAGRATGGLAGRVLRPLGG